MKTILGIIGRAVAVYLTLSFVPGLSYSGGWVTIFIIAIVWALISLVIRPVLSILTLPINILTIGLFSLVLNGVLFWCMTFFIPEFHIMGLFPAILGALVLSILTSLIGMIL